jgi:hypothetical protein
VGEESIDFVDFFNEPADVSKKKTSSGDTVLEQPDTDIHMTSIPISKLLRRRCNPSRWGVFKQGMWLFVMFMIGLMCGCTKENVAMGAPPEQLGPDMRRELDDKYPESRTAFKWYKWTDWDDWAGKVYQEVPVAAYMLLNADATDGIGVDIGYDQTPHKTD